MPAARSIGGTLSPLPSLPLAPCFRNLMTVCHNVNTHAHRYKYLDSSPRPLVRSAVCAEMQLA